MKKGSGIFIAVALGITVCAASCQKKDVADKPAGLPTSRDSAAGPQDSASVGGDSSALRLDRAAGVLDTAPGRGGGDSVSSAEISGKGALAVGADTVPIRKGGWENKGVRGIGVGGSANKNNSINIDELLGPLKGSGHPYLYSKASDLNPTAKRAEKMGSGFYPYSKASDPDPTLTLKKKNQLDGPRNSPEPFICRMPLTGGRSRASTQRVVMQNMAPLRYAYNERLSKRPGLTGKITVYFKINEFGKVIHAEMTETTINDSELERFVVSSIKKWKFDKIDKQGDTSEVTYPFVFAQ